MKILIEIRKELKAKGDPQVRESALRFFKEETKHYGWRNGDVMKLSREKYQEVKKLNKEAIFSLCEELWKSGYMEEAMIACDWSYRQKKIFEEKDFKLFEKWVGRYVSNWATCDTFCCRTLGEFLKTFPAYAESVMKWTKSANRWYRRASAVSFILPARQGEFLNESFVVSKSLLKDEDDLVQKGYGWLLKTQSEPHLKEVFDFVMKNKQQMPRTALRYAIEKMPKALKKQAMAR